LPLPLLLTGGMRQNVVVVRAFLAQVEILWRRVRVIIRAVKAWRKNAVEALLRYDVRKVLLRTQDAIKQYARKEAGGG